MALTFIHANNVISPGNNSGINPDVYIHIIINFHKHHLHH